MQLNNFTVQFETLLRTRVRCAQNIAQAKGATLSLALANPEREGQDVSVPARTARGSSRPRLSISGDVTQNRACFTSLGLIVDAIRSEIAWGPQFVGASA